jgi:hypothetical protein
MVAGTVARDNPKAQPSQTINPFGVTVVYHLTGDLPPRDKLRKLASFVRMATERLTAQEVRNLGNVRDGGGRRSFCRWTSSSSSNRFCPFHFPTVFLAHHCDHEFG